MLTTSAPTIVPASTQSVTAGSAAKDSRWLTLEVCREYQRNKCSRDENECKFAHPPPHIEVQNGRVVCCYDSIKGKCQRKEPPCKYLHPPQHLREQLLENGRNNLILKNIQMQILHQQLLAHNGGVLSLSAPYFNGHTQATPFSLFHPGAAPGTPLPLDTSSAAAAVNLLSGANNPSVATLSPPLHAASTALLQNQQTEPMGLQTSKDTISAMVDLVRSRKRSLGAAFGGTESAPLLATTAQRAMPMGPLFTMGLDIPCYPGFSLGAKRPAVADSKSDLPVYAATPISLAGPVQYQSPAVTALGLLGGMTPMLHFSQPTPFLQPASASHIPAYRVDVPQFSFQ